MPLPRHRDRSRRAENPGSARNRGRRLAWISRLRLPCIPVPHGAGFIEAVNADGERGRATPGSPASGSRQPGGGQFFAVLSKTPRVRDL